MKTLILQKFSVNVFCSMRPSDKRVPIQLFFGGILYPFCCASCMVLVSNSDPLNSSWMPQKSISAKGA